MTAPQLEAIAIACVRECVRQQVGVDSLSHLLAAYDYALERASVVPSEVEVAEVARLIHPAENDGYRRIPVTFRSGSAAADWRDVPGAVGRLFSLLDGDTDPVEFVRALLAVHPWADGNGRTAFVVLNWLSGTLTDPQPLPDFAW